MMWDLPTSVEIDGKKYEIRDKCDYRVILDVICVLNDDELDEKEKILCALAIFYGNEDISTFEKVANVVKSLPNIEKAVEKMANIINLGKNNDFDSNKPRLMDWEHDFSRIAPPISRVLGYSVRDSNHYTHWYDFIGAYMEIGECTFSTVVSIRDKRARGKKLEKWEQEFYNENKKMVDLPQNLTEEEKEWLDSDW